MSIANEKSLNEQASGREGEREKERKKEALSLTSPKHFSFSFSLPQPKDGKEWEGEKLVFIQTMETVKSSKAIFFLLRIASFCFFRKKDRQIKCAIEKNIFFPTKTNFSWHMCELWLPHDEWRNYSICCSIVISSRAALRSHPCPQPLTWHQTFLIFFFLLSFPFAGLWSSLDMNSWITNVTKSCWVSKFLLFSGVYEKAYN